MNNLFVYFGTYTNNTNKSKGIYHSSFNADSGVMTQPELAVESVNPSYILIKGNHLYTVNETDTFNGQNTGFLTSFRIGRKGELELINRMSSRGANPVHLCSGKNLNCIFFANYGNKNKASSGIAVMKIDNNGALSEVSHLIPYTGSSVDPERQREPHAHSINLVTLDNGKHLVLSSDLGTDMVHGYFYNDKAGRLDRTLSLSVNPGYGPRHLAIGASKKVIYQINELISVINVCSLDHDSGKLTIIQTIPAHPDSLSEIRNYPAEIVVHPSGRFLYVSNRGRDTIASFNIDTDTGWLAYAGETSSGGKFPRDFEISPDGRYLITANQLSDNAAVFYIDDKSGNLTLQELIDLPAPVCVKFYTPGSGKLKQIRKSGQ